MSHCQITLSVNAGVALHLGAMRVWSDALHDRRVVGFSTVTPERWNILQAHPDFASPDLLFFTHCHPDHYSRALTEQVIARNPQVALVLPEQEFDRQGLKLSRQTMANWILQASDTWLRPVYDALHRKLFQETVLHGDETTLQVLKEPGKSAQSKSYMWLYRTGKYASQPMILYEYRPDRKASNAETSLKEFSGWLHADGYPGYHRLPEHIRVVGCWAHLRRKFDEAVKSLP